MYQHSPQSRKSSSSSTAGAWKSYDDAHLSSVASEVSYEAEKQRRLRKYKKPSKGLFFNDDELYQLDQGSELSYNEDPIDQIENESSRELLRESKLTRMEAKIGLIQSNLTELKDEMRRIQNPPASSIMDNRKSTKQLQNELRIADDLLSRLEQEELEERQTPKKGSPIKHDYIVNNEEQNSDNMETLIDQEMNILKRIYADNLEFLLVVMKEMKFISSNSSRMDCLDFLSQIRKKEENEIEKLKSPKKIENVSLNKSSLSLPRTLPFSESGSLATSVRAMKSSEKDTDSLASEDDQSFSVTADLIGFLTTKVEDLLMKMEAEKQDEGFRGVISKGDVVHICKETWSFLQDLDIECEVETINPIFDVLELFIGKAFDSQTQEDMLTDIMDVITTFLFYYRAVSQLVNSTSVMPTKEQRAFIEPRLEKLRLKKDADLDSIIRNRNQYIRFKERQNIQSAEPSSYADDEESSFIDEEEEDEEDQSERNYTPLDHLMTLEELMERNGINDELEEEMKQSKGFDQGEGGESSFNSDDEETGEVDVPTEVVRNKYATEDFSSSKSSSPKRVEEKKDTSIVLKQLGFNVNSEKINKMMQDEENDLEIQFLSRVSAITVPGSNQDRDYAGYSFKNFQ